VGLLLDHFGHRAAADRVEAAVVASFEAGQTTPDLGGELTTDGAASWIIEHLEAAYAHG
jgi:isocitrate/isopropylmalate dehydrogenase